MTALSDDDPAPAQAPGRSPNNANAVDPQFAKSSP
jgi:hypothetical protein